MNFLSADPLLGQHLKVLRENPRDRGHYWSSLLNRLTGGYLSRLSGHILEGLGRANFLHPLHAFSPTGALYSLLAPYSAADSSFAQDRLLARAIARHFALPTLRARPSEPAMAHFTATFLRPRRQGSGTGREKLSAPGHHEPAGVFRDKAFPPALFGGHGLLCSAGFQPSPCRHPGPLGVAALDAAWLLKLPLKAPYHPDIPRQAEHLSGDHGLGELLWRYLLWFYEQAHCLLVPSRSPAGELAVRGLKPEKISIMPRGADLIRFRSGNGNGCWKKYPHLREGLKLLDGGRVSREKNLSVPAKVFKKPSRERPDLSLIGVGDGPCFQELKKEPEGTRIYFSEALAALSASCDLIVFPSSTRHLWQCGPGGPGPRAAGHCQR